jgi:hypothetical protein
MKKANLWKKLALALLVLAPATSQTTEAKTAQFIAIASTTVALALTLPHIKKAALDTYEWFFWKNYNYMNWLNFEITRLEHNYDFVANNNYSDYTLGQIATKNNHPQYRNYSYAQRTLTPLACGLAFVEHDLVLCKNILKDLIKRGLICDPTFNKIVWWYQTLSNIKNTIKCSSRYQQEALHNEEQSQKQEKIDIQREQLQLQRQKI